MEEYTRDRIQENRYKQNGTAEKLLGAVYTPPRVASALIRWGIRSPNDKVLDPACGEGVFLAAARTRLADLGNVKPTCVGVDIDPKAAEAASAVCSDFFEWAQEARDFDVIVGNPPFIRSHLFPEISRRFAFEQMEELGVRPSRLMSTWAPFVALSSKLLSESGRLAFVVPEELLHVGYAAQVRQFLLSQFRRVIICIPNGDLFPNVQQSVVLLLCEKDSQGISGLYSMDFKHLETGPPYVYRPAPIWNWCSKWTHLFLSNDERTLVNDCLVKLKWKPLKEYGRVEVGVVTGSNDFFIISNEQAERLGKSRFLEPIVTSARDLKGIKVSADDFRALSNKGRPVFLIKTAEPLEKLPHRLRNYLRHGSEQKIHLRFKCRNRDPWYAVPSIWPADALLLRQAGEMPKLVHLTKKCTSTDTIHRVRWKKPSLGKRYVASFLNTWTLITCELTGRSYGGGVLELMPSEANNILLPPPLPELDTIFDDLDAKVRSRNFEAVISTVDENVTPRNIKRLEYEEARQILYKLIQRRKTKQNGNH